MLQGYEMVRDKRWNDVDTKFCEHRSHTHRSVSSVQNRRVGAAKQLAHEFDDVNNRF